MKGFWTKKKIIIASAVILAVLGAAAAIIFFGGADAKQTYFKAESGNFKEYLNFIDSKYNTLKNSQQPYISSAYRRRTEYTADICSGGKPFGMNNADRLFDVIKDSKLIVDTKRQPVEDYAVSDISLLIEKAPFIDTQVSTGNGRLYFTVPVLLPDRYFSAELDKLYDVYDKFSVPVRPKRLVNLADIFRALEYDRDSLNATANEIGSIFVQAFTDDTVSFGKSKEITIGDKIVKGKEVIVKLDSSSATTLLKDLTSFISTKKTLLSYTYENFANISEMLDDAGLFRLFEFLDKTGVVVLNDNEKAMVDKLNVAKDTEGFAKNLRAVLDTYTLSEGLNMTVFIDRSGNIVNRELSLSMASEEAGKSFKLNLKTGSTGNNDSLKEDSCIGRYFNIVITQPDKTTEINYTPELEKNDENGVNGSMALSCKIAEAGKDEAGVDIKLNISGSTDTKTLKRNRVVKFDANIYGSDGSGVLQGELHRTAWSNKKLGTLNSTTTISVQADLPTFGIQDLDAVVGITGEDTMNIGGFEMPDMADKAVTDLNAASDSDLDRLQTEAIASFGGFYLTNKPVFDAILNQ